MVDYKSHSCPNFLHLTTVSQNNIIKNNIIKNNNLNYKNNIKYNPKSYGLFCKNNPNATRKERINAIKKFLNSVY
jgi:hypothetical protein